MELLREFRKETGRGTRPNVWFIGCDPENSEVIVTKWGVLNGAVQETRDRPGSCGVEGHADYQTASEYVTFCIDREIRKKTECGYVEWVDGKPLSKVATHIDFDVSLPKNLSFYKPKIERNDAYIC
jgi:hypothetical protein